MNKLLLLGLLALSALAISNASASTESVNMYERCRAELLGRHGNILQTFLGTGYYRQDACTDARYQCEDELRYRQSRGGARGLTCRVIRNGNGGGYGRVSASCSVDLRRDSYGRQGGIIRSFRMSARAYDHRTARQEACRSALRECNRFKQQRGYYRASCTRVRSGDRYDPPRRNPGRTRPAPPRRRP